MKLHASKRGSVAQVFAPFNYSGTKHAINFGYGLPDPAMFAELPWPDAFDQNTGVAAADLAQYTDAAGLPELVTKLALRYGVRHDHVMVTGGASQAIQLLIEAWIDPGDVVLTEDPSYLGALRTFSVMGATVVQLGMSGEGVDLNELEATLRSNSRVKLFYTTPAFHNPTGREVSRIHMARLAALLAQHGLPLVQDLVYAELPYNEVVDWLAPGGNVINVHSVSKIAGPGLRVGWVLAEPNIISRLARLKCDGGVSPIVSNIVLGLLQSGALDRHIGRLRQHYRAKRDTMHTLLQYSRICEPEYIVPSGGFSFWVRLSAGIDVDTFIEAARREHDVHLIHGRHYGPRSGDHVRLCFSYLPLFGIEQGLARLDDLHAKLYTHSHSPIPKFEDLNGHIARFSV
ncbi:aminotransferase-like domain-containing protein [Bradyrhizobium cenepequi]|uniref:aminotransferase-like domain-containing protein n=1 Tax=Bradyrhizobium cenepequi TaxID=2821403 RepID=UPI001CE30EA4|nr:PLP-dependent aminotransferase family protein [Bradyrhizobium cenepequi]MCA6112616.1 PLP-dependent aminotransferase family protein [Bradyrhizobium cenepequi]